MVKRLMAVMLMALLIAAVASAGGVAEADEPTPPANTPEDELADARQFIYDNGSYGDGLLFVASGDSAAGAGGVSASNIEPNPWGCRIRVHNPHQPHDPPGPGHVRGKATIECSITPPAGHVAVIWQELSRWEGSNSTIEEDNTSVCPTGDGNPDCYPRLNGRVLMRGYVVTPCEVGQTYVWVQLGEATLTVEGVAYTGFTGNGARVRCTNQ